MPQGGRRVKEGEAVKKRIKVKDVVSVKVGPLSEMAGALKNDGTLVAPSANDTQVGGGHYKARAIEPWDIVAVLGLDPFQADTMYYLLRWREKGGLEDLEKAAHWLRKYIEVERLRKELGDEGMRARLLEAAFMKARRRADQMDKDARLYFGYINKQQERMNEQLRECVRAALDTATGDKKAAKAKRRARR